MLVLHTWQIVTVLVIAFLFGFFTGRTFGESRAWEKMDKQEEGHRVTGTGETYSERNAYHDYGELSPGEHAQARAIRESLNEPPE